MRSLAPMRHLHIAKLSCLLCRLAAQYSLSDSGTFSSFHPVFFFFQTKLNPSWMARGVSRYLNLDVNGHGLICACRFYLIPIFPVLFLLVRFGFSCVFCLSLSLSLSFFLKRMWSARRLLTAPPHLNLSHQAALFNQDRFHSLPDYSVNP